MEKRQKESVFFFYCTLYIPELKLNEQVIIKVSSKPRRSRPTSRASIPSRGGVFLCRRLLQTVAMGQVLSLLICGTAVSCQFLADAGVRTPMLQSFLNYALLLLTYTLVLCTRKGAPSAAAATLVQHGE